MFVSLRECVSAQVQWASACQLTAEPSALRGQHVSQWEGDMSVLPMLMSVSARASFYRRPDAEYAGRIQIPRSQGQLQLIGYFLFLLNSTFLQYASIK